MKWEVYRNNKPLGIVETDFAWASRYWSGRERLTGDRFRLVPL